MKKLMILSGLMLVMYRTGFAQETKEDTTQGYVFFAPGVETPGRNGIAHMGGGGELLFNALGVGAEIGYQTPIRSFGNGIGVFSPNVAYHFMGGKLSPFVTGGYSLFFRSGHANGYNFGGGVNYWMLDRTALRLEVRDNVLPGYRDVHFLGFRVGLSFR